MDCDCDGEGEGEVIIGNDIEMTWRKTNKSKRYDDFHQRMSHTHLYIYGEYVNSYITTKWIWSYQIPISKERIKAIIMHIHISIHPIQSVPSYSLMSEERKEGFMNLLYDIVLDCCSWDATGSESTIVIDIIDERLSTSCIVVHESNTVRCIEMWNMMWLILNRSS